MTRYLTPEERIVQRYLGDRARTLDRALQVSRGEIHVAMLADQIAALEQRLGSVHVRYLLSPVKGVPFLNWTGAASGTTIVVYGTLSQDFSAVGTINITTTGVVTVTLIGIAAGGGGNGTKNVTGGGYQDGGGGGGSASYTTGTAIIMVPGKTYALVIPAGGLAAANGGALTLGDGTTTFVSLDGGKGQGGIVRTKGTKGLASSSTGSNRVDGKDGGDGGGEGSVAGAAGGADTSAAGGGGGGAPADALVGPYGGGNGKDHTGSAGVGGGTGHGGDGGGRDFNSVSCGWGGGGRNNDNSSDQVGRAGGQGGCRLTA